MPRPRVPASPFRSFNSSPEVIRAAVMLYIRYPLSLRNVEDLLFERGKNSGKNSGDTTRIPGVPGEFRGEFRGHGGVPGTPGEFRRGSSGDTREFRGHNKGVPGTPGSSGDTILNSWTSAVAVNRPYTSNGINGLVRLTWQLWCGTDDRPE